MQVIKLLFTGYHTKTALIVGNNGVKRCLSTAIIVFYTNNMNVYRKTHVGGNAAQWQLMRTVFTEWRRSENVTVKFHILIVTKARLEGFSVIMLCR